MKKFNVLPLVLALPLLVSCGAKDVKAPKFAKEGDKVEYEAWNEANNTATKANAFFPDAPDALLPSFKASSETESINKTEVKREKKVVRSNSNYSKSSEEYQSDTANGLIRTKEDRRGVEESKTPNGTSKTNTKHKYEHSYQKGTYEDKEYMMDVRVPYKTYVLDGQVTETTSYAKLLDNEARNIVNLDIMLPTIIIATYSLADEEEKKNFSFYQKGDLFTAEYKKEEKGIETKDAEDKVKWSADKDTSWKIQFDFTSKESFKLVYYYELITTTTYNVSNSPCMPGDVKVETRKESFTAEVAKKDVSLKAEDLSKFIKV